MEKRGACRITTKRSILLGALILLKWCAFDSLGQASSSFSCGTNLHMTEAFLSDSCCVQHTERRRCVDDEFCTGVVMSHPSSFLTACCDDYESCGDTKNLFKTLGILEKLSVTDFALSTIIIVVLLAKIYFKYTLNAYKQKRGCTILLAVLEFFALVLNLVIVAYAVNSNALHTAEDLKDAECFTTANDAAIIGDTINHLKHYRLIAILEAVFDFLLLTIHILEVRQEQDDDKDNGWSLLESSGLIFDIGEEFFAAINLFVLLRPAMRDLEYLYDSLSMNPATSVNQTSQPCIYSCCLAFLVKNTTIASLPTAFPSRIDPTTSPSKNVPPVPSSTPPLPFTERPTMQDPDRQQDPEIEPIMTERSTTAPTKNPSENSKFSSSPSNNPTPTPTASPLVTLPTRPPTAVAELSPAPSKPSTTAPNSNPHIETCASDSSCSSGVCVKGRCMENKQLDLSPCDTNTDCVSGGCYLENFSKQADAVCCPEGYVYINRNEIPWSNSNTYFCKYQQKTGKPCASNNLCTSGVCVDGICASGKIENLEHCDDNNDCESRYCYLQNFTETAQTVCCPEGYVYVNGNNIPWSNSNKYFCKYQQKTGEPCASNYLCTSGVCVDGICASGKSENLEHCDDNNDCESRYCYLQNFTETAQTVCCPDGYVSVSGSDIPWSNSNKYFCKYQQKTGEPCASNYLCTSGVCVDGICASGKIENLEHCDDNNDCESGRCYLESFTETAQTVCCPEGYVYVNGNNIPWSNSNTYFCKYQQKTGEPCASNLLCESGICQDHVCIN